MLVLDNNARVYANVDLPIGGDMAGAGAGAGAGDGAGDGADAAENEVSQPTYM